MKKELYLILLLFILIPSGSVNAQMAELSAAVEMLEKASGQETLQTEEKKEEVDEENKDKKAPLERLGIVEENYGYTGAKNFANSPQEKFLDGSLSYFGYDLFFNNENTFTSPKNLPTPPSYVLGPGDEFAVKLYGSTNTTWEMVVSKLGDIFLPGIGPLLVAGQTFGELKQAIEEDNQQNTQEELGDLLFSIINLSRHLEIDSDMALTKANLKFIDRFLLMENELSQNQKKMEDVTLEDLEKIWVKIKSYE